MTDFMVRLGNLTVQPRRNHVDNEPENTTVFVAVFGEDEDKDPLSLYVALTEQDVRILIESLLAASEGEDTETRNMNPHEED